MCLVILEWTFLLSFLFTAYNAAIIFFRRLISVNLICNFLQYLLIPFYLICLSPFISQKRPQLHLSFITFYKSFSTCVTNVCKLSFTCVMSSNSHFKFEILYLLIRSLTSSWHRQTWKPSYSWDPFTKDQNYGPDYKLLFSYFLSSSCTFH